MASDLGVHSLTPAAPVSRKETIDSIKAPEAKQVERGTLSDVTSAAALAAGKKSEKADLEQTVQDLNGLVQDLQRQVRFSLDDDSGEMVVKVVDRQTDDVIRQIPTEDVLQLRQRLELATGAIFEDKA